jgi:hypothetical protein
MLFNFFKTTTLALGTLAIANTANADPLLFDLREWSQQGNPSNGEWNISDAGTSVLQTINGNPTFFVSQDELIDTMIRGTFKVTPDGAWDDDFIGFTFGYQSPFATNGDRPDDFEFILFDWKRNAQTFFGYEAQEGFSLARVNGTITDSYPSFWQHSNSSEFELLASDYGAGKGWVNNVEYEFKLIYQADRIQVSIDNNPIFDISGEFRVGHFGFYNFSQQAVYYSAFTREPLQGSDVNLDDLDGGEDANPQTEDSNSQQEDDEQPDRDSETTQDPTAVPEPNGIGGLAIVLMAGIGWQLRRRRN